MCAEVPSVAVAPADRKPTGAGHALGVGHPGRTKMALLCRLAAPFIFIIIIIWTQVQELRKFKKKGKTETTPPPPSLFSVETSTLFSRAFENE
jgi:hypothetical protein